MVGPNTSFHLQNTPVNNSPLRKNFINRRREEPSDRPTFSPNFIIIDTDRETPTSKVCAGVRQYQTALGFTSVSTWAWDTSDLPILACLYASLPKRTFECVYHRGAYA
ncbi:hypothetical protein FVE85_3361 [Porphyridium purpureum]|uniref:Uncharacterized protein n=1 Tax=Porphyridium purpureum TaxID=35688 RepID=A0A5J4YW23_PORPP|nr:hypothetical protein FVE85_3361 [Porphyridium purpureum]|eukprot:POR4793..scf227_4